MEKESEFLFFELLQVAIGRRTKFSCTPNEEQWEQIYELCLKHGLLGIGYIGISKIPQEQSPVTELLVKFVHDSLCAQKQNQEVTAHCQELTRKFEEKGYWNIVLKGQSNIENYVIYNNNKPVNIGEYRASGDIDVWLVPKGHNLKVHRIKPVVEFSLRLALNAGIPKPRVRYNHVKLANIWNEEVEIHYRPSFLSSPWRNWRLQKWFEANSLDTPRYWESIPVPTNKFNAIYQLTHIHRHIFEDGIGLRQLLDYYFVLQNTDQSDHTEIYNAISQFGMKTLASAIMWILAYIFEPYSINDNNILVLTDWKKQWSWMICQPNEKEGRFLLNEIMMAGNFGIYDNRITRSVKFQVFGMRFSLPTKLLHAEQKTKHNLNLLRHYPEEVIWEPVFRFYHYIWRTLKLWKF